MARNRLADYIGYWPLPSRRPPDGTTKPPEAKRGTRPRIDKSLATRMFSAGFRTFRDWKLWLLFFAAFHIAAAPGLAQVSKEYQLKAVFLWRLAQFTEWPATAFEHVDSPTIICVLGDNPFGDALNAAVAGETANGRKLVVQYRRPIEQIKSCHILYISGAGPRQAKEIAAALAGRSILTVRDTDGVASSYETMIHFITEENKIKLRINLKAATSARLVLDPRLLRAAEIIGNE